MGNETTYAQKPSTFRDLPPISEEHGLEQAEEELREVRGRLWEETPLRHPQTSKPCRENINAPEAALKKGEAEVTLETARERAAKWFEKNGFQFAEEEKRNAYAAAVAAFYFYKEPVARQLLNQAIKKMESAGAGFTGEKLAFYAEKSRDFRLMLDGEVLKTGEGNTPLQVYYPLFASQAEGMPLPEEAPQPAKKLIPKRMNELLVEWRKPVGPNGESALWREYEKKMNELSSGFEAPPEVKALFEKRLREFNLRITVGKIESLKINVGKSQVDIPILGQLVEPDVKSREKAFSMEIDSLTFLESSQYQLEETLKHELTHYLSAGSIFPLCEEEVERRGINRTIEEGATTYLTGGSGYPSRVEFVVSFLRQNPKMAPDFWRYYFNIPPSNVDFYIGMSKAYIPSELDSGLGSELRTSGLLGFFLPFVKQCDDLGKLRKLSAYVEAEIGEWGYLKDRIKQLEKTGKQTKVASQ